MNLFKKNTVIIFRVFFLLFIIGIIGIIWQKNNSFISEIKAEGGHINEGIVGTPRFINPVLAQTQTDLDITRLVFTPILDIDRQGNTFYNIAENIESSPDKKTYTLQLRNDIYFEDNRPVTADDVVFTIESIQDPLIKSPLSSKWQGIKVEKKDQWTVVFTLDQAFNDFLYNLEIGIIPKHIWENIDPQEFIFSNYNTQPIGSGPYRVHDIITKDNGVPEKYILKSSKISSEKPYISTINILFFDNQESLIKAIKRNDVDTVYGISAEYIDTLDDSISINSKTLPRVFAIFFNQEKQAIFKSQKIREAINYAINKENIVDTVFEGYASITHSAIGSPAESIFSPKKSRELIESDGWVSGENGIYEKTIDGQKTTLSFSLSIPNIEEMKNVADRLKDDLENIGIEMMIRSYDQGNLNQNIMRPREYESLLFGYQIEKPSDLYAFWHSSQINDPGLNVSLFKDTQIDNDLASLRSKDTVDINALDTKITKTTPAIFLYSPSYIYILPDNTHDTSFSITSSSDRFNSIDTWYQRTRHIWPFFIEEEK